MSKKTQTIFLSIAFLLIVKISFAQQIPNPTIPTDYFRSPLGINIFLAGSFGEIRPNHFHSGIDIKTNQREGYPIYAVADGYVSRLRVQIGGFGNAVYINHPNGVTSVYGHLQKFKPHISMMVKMMQYRKESFTMDFNLLPIEIPVKKGDIIAWSGNTGSSAGPHLHFELRDTKTEETMNALTLGIDVKDHIKPTINGFYLYQTNGQSFNEYTQKKYYQTVGANGKYSLNKINTISVNGEVGLGIMAFDQQDGSANHNGLFSTSIKLDGKVIYQTVVSRFSFENTRAVNSYIDYPAKLTANRVIQKGFAAPNPKVKLYTDLVNNGLIDLKDAEIHQVEYILKDYAGNESVLKFNIKYSGTEQKASTTPKGELMSWGKNNVFENEDVNVNLPQGILYDDLYFQFSSTPKLSYGASRIFKIHNRLTPVHDVYQLSIKLDSSYYQQADKALIMNTVYGNQGGSFKDGYVVAFPKVFGDFYIRFDSIPPKINPINIQSGSNLAQQKTITLTISDNLSGLKSFDAYIDGEWVLMEYDYRTAKVWYTFDEKYKSGKHSFRLSVTDMKDNNSTYSVNFYR